MHTSLHPRQNGSNRERRLVQQMMGPNQFMYNNMLRQQQMYVAQQNWYMQLQMLYGPNYTGLQAQQATMNAAYQRQQRVGSAAWRGGMMPFGDAPPGSGDMRGFPRSPAGFQRDMQGPQVILQPGTRQRLQRAQQQVNYTDYQPYTPQPQPHLRGFGRPQDQPVTLPTPVNRPQRGVGFADRFPVQLNPDYNPNPYEFTAAPVAPQFTSPPIRRYESQHQLITGDIQAVNPETGRTDINRSYRGTRFWEQGRPKTLAEAGGGGTLQSTLNQIRTEANLSSDPRRRLDGLYIAHRLEEICTSSIRYARQNYGRIDEIQHLQHFIDEFNQLTREVIRFDPQIAHLLSRNLRTTISSHVSMEWHPVRGWTFTMNDISVSASSSTYAGRTYPRTSVNNGSASAKQQYEKGQNAGTAGKQQYEKNQTARTDQGRKKTAADSPTSIKSGNEGLKKSQESLGKLNTQLQDLIKLEATRKKASQDVNKQLADLQSQEAETEKQLQNLRKDREDLSANSKKLEANLEELLDPARLKAEMDKMAAANPDEDALLAAVRKFQLERKNQQQAVKAQIEIVRNSMNKLDASLTIAETSIKQLRNQSSQLRLQVTKVQTEFDETHNRVADLQRQQQELQKKIDAMQQAQRGT